MSTLWTPGGEVPVSDRPADTGPSSTADPSMPEGLDLDSLSPEERQQAEQYIRELAESRQRLKSVPASVVVANHAMGLYELAALHLADQPPNLTEATVAIDALGALLDGMKGRLGEPEATLCEAMAQIRMAFVQLKNRPQDPATTDAAGDDTEADCNDDSDSRDDPVA